MPIVNPEVLSDSDDISSWTEISSPHTPPSTDDDNVDEGHNPNEHQGDANGAIDELKSKKRSAVGLKYFLSSNGSND